jgi:hypothetical protein
MKKTPQQHRERRRGLKRQEKAELVAYKGGLCHDCHNAFPDCCFQFDHRIPAEKSFAVTTAATHTMEERKREANKCDLVCANCHCLRTFNNVLIAAKVSAALKDREFSAETLLRMSDSKKGKSLSQEHRRSIGAAQLGRVLSPEHKAAIADTVETLWKDPEWSKATSEAIKRGWTPARRETAAKRMRIEWTRNNPMKQEETCPSLCS